MERLAPGLLAARLLEASDWLNNALLERLAQRGWPRLTRSQSLIFVNLGTGGVRPAELARRVGVRRQSMHTALAELEAAGLVALRPEAGNRRAKTVSLSPDGKRLVRDARRILSELEAVLAQRIGAETVEQLRAALAVDWGPPP